MVRILNDKLQALSPYSRILNANTLKPVRFEVFTAANMKMAVFWVVETCSLMLETASTSETSVSFYQTTRRNNPGDSHFHTRRRENLIFYISILFMNLK
jgi:hypothetical protein